MTDSLVGTADRECVPSTTNKAAEALSDYVQRALSGRHLVVLFNAFEILFVFCQSTCLSFLSKVSYLVLRSELSENPDSPQSQMSNFVVDFTQIKHYATTDSPSQGSGYLHFHYCSFQRIDVIDSSFKNRSLPCG